MSSSLAGLNVLIAEDEVIIAYDLAQGFENAGQRLPLRTASRTR